MTVAQLAREPLHAACRQSLSRLPATVCSDPQMRMNKPPRENGRNRISTPVQKVVLTKVVKNTSSVFVCLHR